MDILSLIWDTFTWAFTVCMLLAAWLMVWCSLGICTFVLLGRTERIRKPDGALLPGEKDFNAIVLYWPIMLVAGLYLLGMHFPLCVLRKGSRMRARVMKWAGVKADPET